MIAEASLVSIDMFAWTSSWTQVCETLEMLRNAGIRIFMLTGDKIETATCIARYAAPSSMLNFHSPSIPFPKSPHPLFAIFLSPPLCYPSLASTPLSDYTSPRYLSTPHPLSDYTSSRYLSTPHPAIRLHLSYLPFK